MFSEDLEDVLEELHGDWELLGSALSLAGFVVWASFNWLEWFVEEGSVATAVS